MQLNELMKNRILVACVAFLLFFSWVSNTAAQEEGQWQFDVTLYGWYAGVDGSVEYPGGPGSGGDIAINASDILENLNIIFMGGFQAHHHRWSIITDVVYIDASDDANRILTAGPAPGVPVNASVGMDIAKWILGGGIGYDLMQTGRGTLAVVGGVRYLAADVDVELDLQGPLSFAGPPRERSGSADLLDGTVGIRGFINLNGEWYIPYHFDVGAGDSDLTWQAFAGLSYRFDWGEVKFGYRHLNC